MGFFPSPLKSPRVPFRSSFRPLPVSLVWIHNAAVALCRYDIFYDAAVAVFGEAAARERDRKAERRGGGGGPEAFYITAQYNFYSLQNDRKVESTPLTQFTIIKTIITRDLHEGRMQSSEDRNQLVF